MAKAKKKLTEQQKYILWMMAFAVFTIILWRVPFGMLVLYPFTILSTWFHEMAHGIIALILGGSFHQLEIYADGSGLAVWSGNLFLGNVGKAIVAAAGPLGPTAAGAILIILSKKEKHIKKIYQAYQNFKDEEGFSKVVNIEEVLENNASLNMPLYVSNVDAEPQISFDEALEQWEKSSQALKKSMEELFEILGGK